MVSTSVLTGQFATIVRVSETCCGPDCFSPGKGPSWAIGNQIDVGKAELARRMAAGVMESEALNAMGRELGIGGAAPRTPLKKALFSDRKRSPPVKVASPLPGVVQVRSGRKTA